MSSDSDRLKIDVGPPVRYGNSPEALPAAQTAYEYANAALNYAETARQAVVDYKTDPKQFYSAEDIQQLLKLAEAQLALFAKAVAAVHPYFVESVVDPCNAVLAEGQATYAKAQLVLAEALKDAQGCGLVQPAKEEQDSQAHD